MPAASYPGWKGAGTERLVPRGLGLFGLLLEPGLLPEPSKDVNRSCLECTGGNWKHFLHYTGVYLVP